MKLIKINPDHYVVVDDSKIDVGDWYIDDAKQIRQSVVSDEVYWQHRPYNREYMKITHSTQPLGIGWQQEVIELSLKEVKELIGEVDVEEIALRYASSKGNVNPEAYSDEQVGRLHGHIDGYNQALEDNKEKKYTEAQLYACMLEVLQKCNKAIKDGELNIDVDLIIQSLQPKDNWEVEIVDGKLKLK